MGDLGDLRGEQHLLHAPARCAEPSPKPEARAYREHEGDRTYVMLSQRLLRCQAGEAKDPWPVLVHGVADALCERRHVQRVHRA